MSISCPFLFPHGWSGIMLTGALTAIFRQWDDFGTSKVEHCGVLLHSRLPPFNSFNNPLHLTSVILNLFLTPASGLSFNLVV
jgi:hypothetical protein